MKVIIYTILSFVCCMGANKTDISYYTFHKDGQKFVLYKVHNKVHNEDGNYRHHIIDSLFADECVTTGDRVFTLTYNYMATSSPPTIFVKEFSFEDDKLKELNETEMKPSYARGQVEITLTGGFLQLKSIRALSQKNIKPSGFIRPYTEEQMVGKKKVRHVLLTSKNLSNIDSIIKDFNDW